MKFKSAGFTLIELLVVIAIIGVIAAVALVAINPLEQIRRSQDQASLVAASSYVGALQSYAAAKGSMPWAITGAPAGCNTVPASAAVSGLTVCTTALINNGELKQSFLTQTSVTSKLFLSVVTVGGVDSPVVCYKPQSIQMTADAVKNAYTIAGAACATPGTNACYVCAF